MSPGRGGVLLIMLVAVVALAAGETALSKGMKQLDRVQGSWAGQLSSGVRNGWIAGGVLLLLAHLGLYMLALKSADLSYALPLTAASYPLAALFARFYLHEEVSMSRGLGTLVITIGVAIVVLGEPGGLMNRPWPAHGVSGNSGFDVETPSSQAEISQFLPLPPGEGRGEGLADSRTLESGRGPGVRLPLIRARSIRRHALRLPHRPDPTVRLRHDRLARRASPPSGRVNHRPA